MNWFKQGQDKIEKFSQLKPNINKAKNVILFIGDGMGLSTVMASRVYKGQQEGRPGEEEVLSFEAFPNVALSKVTLIRNWIFMCFIYISHMCSSTCVMDVI